MRILFASLPLVLLFVAGLSKPEKLHPKPRENRPEETPYEKFKRQHVDAKMTANNCNKKMSCRKIYKNDNSCKSINTFILSDEKTVKSICQGEGRYDPKSSMTYSKKQFRIVKCKLKSHGARKPNCQYKGRRFTNRTIAVRCDRGLPVHYYDNDADLITLGKENNEEIQTYVIVN